MGQSELWNQFFQDEGWTNLLKTRLMRLFLDICSFIGEEIDHSEWKDDGPIKNERFQGTIVIATRGFSQLIFVMVDAAIR